MMGLPKVPITSQGMDINGHRPSRTQARQYCQGLQRCQLVIAMPGLNWQLCRSLFACYREPGLPPHFFVYSTAPQLPNPVKLAVVRLKLFGMEMANTGR